jgi:cullin 1
MLAEQQTAADSDSKDQQRSTHFSNTEYAELYTCVYEMCIAKPPYSFTAQLYERYTNSVNEYQREVVLPAILEHSGEYLLQELVVRWNSHLIMKRWLFSFFMYLDRFYVKRFNQPPVKQVCDRAFSTIVFDYVQPQATDAMLKLIENERDGKLVDGELIRNGKMIFVSIGGESLDVYVRFLEEPIVNQTKIYYAREASSWLETDSCSEYLIKAERRMAEEAQRMRDYMHPRSEDNMNSVLFDTLLHRHQQEILDKPNTGLSAMLKAHALSDLARVYRLYSRVNASLEPIGKTVRDHIRTVGTDLIAQAHETKGQSKFVQELIHVHDKYHTLVTGCFDGHAIFHRALKEAFEDIVNQHAFSVATSELLAEYSDQLLRKGGIRMPVNQLHDTLDKVVRMFTYLTDKDMFSEFYRKLLARRLLLNRSASVDAERSMIGKLKLRMGAQFTSKLEGMINDMETAEENKTVFEDHVRSGSLALGMDFSVQVLTTGYWPTYPIDELKLPPFLNNCLDAFKVFYNEKTSNRRLRWVHSLGVMTVSGNFTKKRIDLVVSTVQANILLLFNEHTELSIQNMINYTGMDPTDIKKYLRSLVSGKCKILVKVPSEGYNVSHIIRVNDKFTHQQRRVRYVLLLLLLLLLYAMPCFCLISSSPFFLYCSFLLACLLAYLAHISVSHTSQHVHLH